MCVHECQSIKKGGKHSLKVYKNLEGTVNFLSPSFIISSNEASMICAGKLFHNGIVLAQKEYLWQLERVLIWRNLLEWFWHVLVVMGVRQSLQSVHTRSFTALYSSTTRDFALLTLNDSHPSSSNILPTLDVWWYRRRTNRADRRCIISTVWERSSV